MDPLVQEYLRRKIAERDAKKSEDRKEVLIEEGLYRKQFAPKGLYSEEYPDQIYDEQEQAYKYYKKIPVVVTDEEYAAIMKLRGISDEPEENSDEPKKNAISVIFKVMGIITFIGGFITGIYFGDAAGYDFSVGVMLEVWAAFFASGMIFLGFAEIIQILDDLKKMADS